MQPNARTRLSTAVFCALCGILGFVLGVSFGYSPLINFDWTLGLNQIVSTASAVTIAVFAAWFLDRRKQDYRTERDLLLRRAEQARDTLKQFESLSAGCDYDYAAASAAVKSSRTALAGLRACLQDRGYPVAAELCTGIDTKFHELRDTLTDGQAQRSVGKRAVRKGRVAVDEAVKAHIESLVTRIGNDYFDLMLRINAA